MARYDAEKQEVDLLVDGWYVVTMNPTRDIIRNGSVAIQGDRIVAVGKTAELEQAYTPARRIGGDRFVITPGLINTHIHITGEPITRGYVPDDTPFEENVFRWLCTLYAEARAGEEQVSAQLALAELYETGVGVEQDDAEAAAWYARAAELLEEEARTGDPGAIERLGDLYLAGHGVPKNVEQALSLYESAADRGRTGAHVKLARLYEKGVEVPADPEETFIHYEAAAEQGHRSATYSLARLYADGEGVPQDGRQAVALYRESAAMGEIRSYARLGDLYAQGEAVPRDEAQAVEWHTRAAEQGDPKGMYRLGQAYERGRGVPVDLVQALMWYRLAEEGDYGSATRGVERVAEKLEPQDTERADQLAEAWQQDQG